MGQLTTYQNYIDGQWSDSVSGEAYTITNPAHKSQEGLWLVQLP